MQYGVGAGARVGGVEIRATHPNRVILVNDIPNEMLVISEVSMMPWPTRRSS